MIIEIPTLEIAFLIAFYFACCWFFRVLVIAVVLKGIASLKDKALKEVEKLKGGNEGV